MNGEARLIELFRGMDNRGREHLLLIAEAEYKHARGGLQLPRGGVLETSAGNLPTERRKRENEG